MLLLVKGVIIEEFGEQGGDCTMRLIRICTKHCRNDRVLIRDKFWGCIAWKENKSLMTINNERRY